MSVYIMLTLSKIYISWVEHKTQKNVCVCVCVRARCSVHVLPHSNTTV